LNSYQCAPLVCLDMASVMSDTDSHASSHLSQHSVKEDIRQNEESELFLPNVARTLNDVEESDEEHDGGEAFEYVVNVETLEEIDMSTDMVFETQRTWTAFLNDAESREAAGEAIYAALFDSAPSLQSLFKTPRAVMAMRFMSGLHNLVTTLADPPAMKMVVETLGFQHLDLDVTVPRVVIFRDAITDLLEAELGMHFNTTARRGWCTFLSYVGGAFVFIRHKYTDRIRILASSWETANGQSGTDTGASKEGFSAESANSSTPLQDAPDTTAASKNQTGSFEANTATTKVPKTFNDMFTFNGAVMGFGSNGWMLEVLESFDALVKNVANSYRFQEECDTLTLRLSKHKGDIKLAEFKAVMLASLRSLVPNDWNSEHEVAWTWLWENVERMMKSVLGKPPIHQRALEKFFAGLHDAEKHTLRREVYAKFFALAPSGQEFFKQSTTRLHFIADKIVEMTLEMYIKPRRMSEDISALGLRHVGYGIPTEFFGPFVTACVGVVRKMTNDEVAEEGFRWSLGLISRILVRTILEGSTIVMKAINANSEKSLKKAVQCAPRGKRAEWLLKVQVGTQAISPLYWAIESGSLEAASAMLEDLVVIRADRDRYYYSVDDLFARHPDVIKRLVLDAPNLLKVLLDGLVWRSRLAENGRRRVNYYVKHLIVAPQ